MVNKKTRKYYYRAYREKMADLTMPEEKKLKEKEERNWSQKGTKYSRRKKLPV